MTKKQARTLDNQFIVGSKEYDPAHYFGLDGEFGPLKTFAHERAYKRNARLVKHTPKRTQG